MKIVIICTDFKKSNIRKFPWKYIYEIAEYLSRKNEIVVITDTESDISTFRVVNIAKIFKIGKGETEELIQILEEEAPDKCIMLLGITSYLRREFRIKVPLYGVFTSPPYKFGELIKNIGFKDSIKYRKYMTIHYLNSIVPSFLIKKWSDKFDKIIFLSEYTMQRIIEKGCHQDKCVLIPPGIERHFAEPPDFSSVNKLRKKINPDNYPVIMYFTSPLTLRGTDTLTKAFSKLRSEIKCKLIFLSRMDYDDLSSEEQYLKEIARKAGLLDSLDIISEHLSPTEIKNYLSVADIICLPFKIVLSDIPVSLLEAISVGKPVISTNVACIPEMIEGRGLVVNANNDLELKDALNKLLNDPEMVQDLIRNGKKFIGNHPDWDDVGDLFQATIRENNDYLGNE